MLKGLWSDRAFDQTSGQKSQAQWSGAYPPLVFAALFVFIFLLHLPLLQLPYFWDEAGYYVPAARDLLLTGRLIPHSTVSNAHPPLVMAWLALWWKVVGYATLVTRTAMLVLAAFALLGVFRLAERVANKQVAIASTLCTALYPVFFAQSSMAQVDLAAAGFIFWGLSTYVEGKLVPMVIWFAVAALTKETAILTPLVLAGWEIFGLIARRSSLRKLWLHGGDTGAGSVQRIASLLIPALPLGLWYVYHYRHTGFVFGNPEFFRYNIAATLNPTRFLLALAMRLWQISGYLHLWILTLPMLLAMWMLPPQRDSDSERPRIGISVQMVFYVVMLTYVVAMALVGGAVLARYMLPAVPLVIILSVSTLWRRLSFWPAAIACVALGFVAAWFWNPPYGFSPEDNLAYRDYVVLHEDGERFLEARYPMARVLTAWPASDEITRPWLGYTTRPMRVVRIEDFSLDEVVSAAEFRSNYEVALIFSTKYEPGPRRWDRWQTWTALKARFFGFHRDLPPAAAAQVLGGRIVFSEQRQGQWIAVIELERQEMQNAEVRVQK
ncbi:MAG TPA: glycosyltransferase family 39 protein [Candidatus Dormibacteraeota bacterium]|nr:glycosyltransferase family 39 protein [Candidatus Dormibacteraeota bacterium]